SEAQKSASRCIIFSRRKRHTRWPRDWSSDVCSSDLPAERRSCRWSSTNDTIYVPPDTTYFARQTLRPLSWSLTGDRIHVVRQFAPDSVHEAVDVTGPHPRSWHSSAKLPGASDDPLVLRWVRFDVALLLQALPLARGWQGSVYSVGLIGRVPGASPFPPLDFRV